MTIGNPAFWLALYLTGVHFRDELQHVGHVGKQKFKCPQIRIWEIDYKRDYMITSQCQGPRFWAKDSGPTILTLQLLMKTLDLGSTINYKTFLTNASSHVKYHTTGKVQFLIFRRFLILLTKCSFWEEE